MMAIIAGFDEKKVLGDGMKLPWSIPDDLKNFRTITSGNTIIMGRKTFESIGRPLPNRNNIVISSKKQNVEGVIFCTSKEEAIIEAKKFRKDIFIIGGATIYSLFLPIADKLYLSHIKGEHKGDIYFPEYDTSQWETESRKEFPDFEFVVYRRK
jgi:dihydrofolate reductase